MGFEPPLCESRADDTSVRLRAGVVSLVVGGGVLAAKWIAYQVTGSTAILSDALESIINVVAAVFALGSIVFAGRPADRNHPYGHGKIEFFSAAFEGGLIAFAAVIIVFESVRTLAGEVAVAQIDLGLAITAIAGAINLALGAFLLRSGRRHRSLTLIADGQHVLADFWTSLGVVIGLVLVRLTAIPQFDPVVALLVGLNLAYTGLRLVRHAAGGLLDEEDSELLEKLIAALNASLVPGIIRIHNLRAMRSGRYTHVDAHLVVPEYWSVQEAHEAADDFERRVIEASRLEGEIVFHTDPCRRAYCAECEIAECPVRVEPLRAKVQLTLDEALLRDADLMARQI